MSTGSPNVSPPSRDTESHGRASGRFSTRRHQMEPLAPVMDSGMFQMPLLDHQET